MRDITVEVVYALPHRQKLIELSVNQGCSVSEAVTQSGILTTFPTINLAVNKVGIFGKAVKKPQTHILNQGDRIEIYRPLPKRNKSNAKAAN